MVDKEVPDVWATELLDIPSAHRHMSPAFT